MRKNMLLCDKWEFCKTPLGTDYSDALAWSAVDLPHDWLIWNTKDLYETSTGWYRRVIDHVPDGSCTALRFEGVYMDCRVYVNGKSAGEWKYGYSSFEFEITNLLKKGENLIAVRVDHHAPNSRWYSGAGIYRRVWLKRYDPCHIVCDGVYISAESGGKVTISAEAERPRDVPAAELSLRHTVLFEDREISSIERGCCACDRSGICELIRRDDRNYSLNTDTLTVEDPTLWDMDQPKLYLCVTELIRNGKVVDRAETKFGFRKIQFTPDKGFFLNDRHVKLHGCCEHHDLGALGAAVNRAALCRKLKKLKRMGVNAIRTSHNMPAVELMELADEMGLLVLSEAFDMWEMPKTEHDYARFFRQWAGRDVASWVRRDRNHPCLIGWSIGNEIYDVNASERGQELTSMLLNMVRQHDHRQNGVVTQGSNFMQGENGQRCADILKIAGYNYGERLYGAHHEKYPDWCIYGSETASVVQSRGIYHFPLSQQMLANDDEQCSSLGNCATGWGAANTEECIILDRDAEFCAGQFIWTGFDYIGEPTPYSTKNSYFGQFDTAGFPKDSAYVFRAEWTDYKKSPFVHIFPHWDFNPGEMIDVRVTSNAPQVELFLNGASVGRKKIDHLHGKALTLNAVLEYEKGTLCAVAYDENGNEIARDVKRSFGDAAKLVLSPDKTAMKADGEDMIFVDISAYDAEGEFAANANDRVFVSVSGAGRLVGLDNGDSTDFEQYKGTSRRLFSGKLLAMIAGKTCPGEIEVRVSSPALPASALTLRALACGKTEGVSAILENSARECDCPDVKNDIPVRKIEFRRGDREFTPEKRELVFETAVYPENASYSSQIEYRLTTATGIISHLGQIVSRENGKVTVRCNGDGEFYLRALCKNGTDRYHILSAIRLSGKGIGAATLDPYQLVHGGLYALSQGGIGSGIKHGAKFAHISSWFGFENVDFGAAGSDTIVLPIFANCTNAVKIRVYDGTPADGELIGDLVYHKEPRWLTYIPETYTLTKVLKGIHTLSFESADGFDIEGFYFKPRRREFAEMTACDIVNIYGDKFALQTDEVTGIGNNVLMDFGVFDFSEKAPSALTIIGRTDLPSNSITVIFRSEKDERVVVEFEHAPEYTARRFPIENISGKCHVSLAFLPGSSFDFRGMRFE